jgi:hypothetical protein
LVNHLLNELFNLVLLPRLITPLQLYQLTSLPMRLLASCWKWGNVKMSTHQSFNKAQACGELSEFRVNLVGIIPVHIHIKIWIQSSRDYSVHINL